MHPLRMEYFHHVDRYHQQWGTPSNVKTSPNNSYPREYSHHSHSKHRDSRITISNKFFLKGPGSLLSAKSPPWPSYRFPHRDPKPTNKPREIDAFLSKIILNINHIGIWISPRLLRNWGRWIQTLISGNKGGMSRVYWATVWRRVTI